MQLELPFGFPIVGLYSSCAQSGKSVVAGALAERGYYNVKFAGPLKDMTRGLLYSMGFDTDTVERMVEGDLKEEVLPGFDTVTPRHVMQTLGTDWGREAVDKDMWTKVALAKIDRLRRLDARVVIDDMRFPNEFKALRARGGFMIRVVRPSAPHVGSSRYEGLLDDQEFDAIITNDGSLEDLRQMAWEATGLGCC